MTPRCTRCEVPAQETPARDPPETPSRAAEAHPDRRTETDARRLRRGTDRRTRGDKELMMMRRKRSTSSAGLQVQMWSSDCRWIVFLDHLLMCYQCSSPPPCSQRSLQHKTHTRQHFNLSVNKARELNYNQACHSLDKPSDSILKLLMSSVLAPSSSAPTPRPLGPIAETRLRAWISSEMVSRLFRAVRYSALAWVSFA